MLLNYERNLEANNRANILAAVRELMIACKWSVKDKISISVDEYSIVIYRGELNPKNTLTELIEKCDLKTGRHSEAGT